MGIHYDYKSTRGAKAMESKPKEKKSLLREGLKELPKMDWLSKRKRQKCTIYPKPLPLKI